MNKQQVFDKVYQAIVKQGRPSLADHGMIAYRGNNGCKCALGHLIPDHVYDPYIENLNVAGILTMTHPENQTVKNHLESVADYPLLRDLQEAHDRAARVYVDMGSKRLGLFMSIFHANMKKVAKRHDLKKNYFV